MTETKTIGGIKIEKPDASRLKELKVESWPIWTKEASSFDWHYEGSETCYFLEGDVTVKVGPDEVSLGKGDLVTFPDGLDCTWTVKRAVRKHYRFD